MRRRTVAPLGVLATLTAGFSLFAGSALASPTVPDIPDDDDIASVDAAAADTAAQIAALEDELAGNQAAVDAANLAAAIAAEKYNAAAVDLEAAEAEQAEAEEQSESAEAELDAASAAMAELAMASYRSGGELAQLGALLSADGFEDAVAEATTYQVLGGSTAAAEQRYEDAEVAAQVASSRAEDAVAERTAAAAELQAASEAADAAAAEAEALLASTQQRHGELVAQLADLRQTSIEMEQARQAAAEAERIAEENAAAAAALGVEDDASDSADDADGADQADDADQAADAADETSEPAAEPTTAEPTSDPTTQAPTQAPTTPAPTTTTTQAPAPTPPAAPPSTSANAAALAWAKTQIGKPYVYGAAGPNAYDCSGLTMMAYSNAGISIARTSASQYYSGDLVPVSQMQPGDLFFYSSNGGPSGIYHVAMYAGNGMRIHAPSPGKSVELVPMWWPNVLDYAVRP